VKRIYSEDGTKSAPAWIVLSAWIIAAPFLLSFAFFWTLIKEIRRAFWYAWLEVRIEVESAQTYWRERRR